MKVIKFGGTSVGEAHAIKQICYILRDKKRQKDRYAIIVSAIGGITDKLVKCAQYAEKKNKKYHLLLDVIEIKHLSIIRKLFTIFQKKNLISRIIKYLNYLEIFYDSICTIKYFSKYSLDKIMIFGESLSSFLINEKLKDSGFFSSWKDSRELIIIENQYESVQVNLAKSFFNIKNSFIKDNTPYIILPGFIASSLEIETITLGRGGSDFSASIFSGALQAELLEIWSDVSGIMTAPPKIVFKSFPIQKISYIEAINLSYFGAKVIYHSTILPSIKNHIPIMIRNTFSPLEMGTLIFPNGKGKGQITGITGVKFLTLERELGMPGKLFASFNSSDIFHVLIKQSNLELYLEKQILRKITNDVSPPLSIEKELYIIVIIVNEMKKIQVTSGRIFSTLSKENIKLRVIVAAEKNISAVIEKKYLNQCLNTLHDIFFKKTYKKIHIFIAGLGQIGSKLIKQLHKQKYYLIEELKLYIRIIAICNSKRMYFNLLGINLNNWQENIKLGMPMDIEEFIGRLYMYNLNLSNFIFIDATASKEIANFYIDILGKGIGVITSNKIACSSSYHEYKNIKNIARYFKIPFLFETNVGAGLPIINTLNYFVQSGDKILIIDAVLSGSLNFIFKNFKGYFTNIIRDAFKRGFTEPDPRIDLSGIDVIRKILILVRECGEDIELEDIKQISLLPKSCIKSSTEDNFYRKLLSNEESFMQLRLVAKEKRKRLILFAKYKYGEAITSVFSEYIELEHPFYQLEGKDNMIIYTSERYADQPLIVKGAGAGDEVTASGIFSDIIKASISR